MIDLLNEKRIVFYLINSDNKINYGDNKEKDFFEIIDKNDSEFFLENLNAAREGEEVLRKKAYLINEEEVWFEFYFVLERNIGIDNVLLIIRNISDYYDQKKILEEKKWKDILDRSPNLLFSINREFKITYINRDFSEININKDQIIGNGLSSFLNEKDYGVIIPFIERVFRTGENLRFEIQSSTFQNQWFLINLSVLYNDPLNGITEVTGVVTDITEKVNTQIQIKESELKFKQMADNAPVMIWISGIDSLCTFFNKYWLDFTGKKLEEEMGDGWLRGVHLGDYDYCLKTYLDAFHSRKSFAMEYRIKRRDGQYRWILDHGVPNFDSEKNFLGYIGSCIDINPRKEFEEKIRSSLKEKEILLKEIHHRVKNNLQIISSLLSLQSSSLKDEKAIAALEDSIHRIRSIGLLHDMLNLAQDSMEIKLEDYISNISDSVMRIHDNFQIRLEKDFSKEKISISIDKAIYIGLIINELLSNSIKYAFREKEGIISVKTELIERNKVRLLYKDNGIGLPENFQLEENNSMGLKLVKMLIIQLGGEMNIIMDNGLHYDILIPLKEKQS